MSSTSDSQSGNLNEAIPVSVEDCLPPDEAEFQAHVERMHLLEVGCQLGAFPLKRHKCWRFEQTVVCDVVDGKPLRWRHLFACVECKRLQSLNFLC